MYMPYEALKKKVYTSKGDIWALGITFYQMLSGESLFKAKSQKDLIRQINYSSIKKVVAQRFCSMVQNALMRMLQFDMNKRATFQELKEIVFGEQPLPMSLLAKKQAIKSQRDPCAKEVCFGTQDSERRESTTKKR